MLPILALVALAAVGASRLYDPDVELPPDLIGTWSTETARYEGRALAFSRDSIRFYSDAEEFEAYAIRSVERDSGSPGGTLYRVQFGEGTAAGSLSFFHRPGVLRLENQPDMEWRPRSETS